MKRSIVEERFRLADVVNSVGENLEQLSSELKDYLHTTMGKSVANFRAVEEDVTGLETILLAAIDGNRRLPGLFVGGVALSI